jgi:HPr kinase/phosphorylase
VASSVKLSSIIQEYNLDLICTPPGYEDVEITVADVNRPSLQLAGFYEYFDPNRIQLIGKVEYTYLESLSPEERYLALENLMKEPIPAVIITNTIRFGINVKKFEKILFIATGSKVLAHAPTKALPTLR